MYFRSLTQDDLDSSPHWWHDRSLASDRWRNEETRSAVAVDDGEIVAAGAIWLSRVHDARFWVDLVVHPEMRRRGIGTAVLGHLATLRCRAAPFAARGYVDEEALLFADACGAVTTQIVPPARVELSARTSLRSHAQVQPLAGIDRARVEFAHAAMYRWTHETWSPVRTDFETALNEDLWEVVDVDASAATVDEEGRISALALTYRDTNPPLIVTETTSRHQAGGEHLVEGCIRRAMAVLAHRGLTTVDFDGHVTDPHFLPALSRLRPTGRWFRLVEIPAP